MTARVALLFLCLLGTLALAGQSQEDFQRRWAISTSLGGSIPLITKNSSAERADEVGLISSVILVEYYLPISNFSLRGGYSKEEMRFYKGDVSTTMNHLMVGGRYYFLPPWHPIQPYGGLDMYCNLSAREENGQMSSYTFNNIKGTKKLQYQRTYHTVNPLLSAVPTLGIDVYFLSSVALTVDYGFRLGIDSRTSIETNRVLPQASSYLIRSKGMRHSFNIGLKVTFPFTLTQQDNCSILDWIFGY